MRIYTHILRNSWSKECICRYKHSKPKQLNIGDVSLQLIQPKRPELVPRGYVPPCLSGWSLNHLRWMMQKEKLGQDMFLIGSPGSAKRQLVMQYLELTGREYEYLSLSRDTTDADIKQRREIKQGSAFYTDLCAVRAAVKGRVLILDGIEKAERNVLPILNNLLENREIQLDDGTFLMHHQKFDKLVKDHSLEKVSEWQIKRVSPNFMVIALGIPVPKFRGHTLDPPLRSRFQCRLVEPIGFQENVEILENLANKVDKERVTALTSFSYGINTEESSDLGLPHFPIDNLHLLARIWNLVPNLEASEILPFVYPARIMLKQENFNNFISAQKTFDLGGENKSSIIVKSVENDESKTQKIVNIKSNKQNVQFNVKSGDLTNRRIESGHSKYVANTEHENVLGKMLLAHSLHDFCIIGQKGCGKSVLVEKFAEMLGYDFVDISLFQDMTSRDLVQSRAMKPNGDTFWTESPLVKAAKTGKIAVLDGLNRVHHSVLNTLQRLVHERELELFDGSKLIHHRIYDKIREKQGFSEKEMTEKNIHPIHPNFRIIALAEPPNLVDSSQNWLIPELLSLFLFIPMPTISTKAQAKLLEQILGENLSEKHGKLLKLAKMLNDSHDINMKSLGDSLSTRQILRISKRLVKYPEEDLFKAVHKACLAKFVPSLTRQTFEEMLGKCDIRESKMTSFEHKECKVEQNILTIGNTSAPIFAADNQSMVPDIIFYDNPQHTALLEDLLRDFLLGEHILLIGNQGVGKNKLTDKFLQLLNRPRQYIQLHRDTTVQTLTLQSSVNAGKLVYEDSALVKAVKRGDVLVIDEGDKAPTYVTCILKSLIQSEYMHLADGRRIVPTHYPKVDCLGEGNLIRMHPDFRVFVLANRPGFPFLGNDFFSAMGDVFSCHIVDNPSCESELSMLQKYAPDVTKSLLTKLVGAFSELRQMADQDIINYPYSTRELVNIVKHIQANPNDNLASVVANVFDFDQFSTSIRQTLTRVMQKHAIPIGIPTGTTVCLSKSFPISNFVNNGKFGTSANSEIIQVKTISSQINWKVINDLNMENFPVETTEMRGNLFSEQTKYWQLPLSDFNIVSHISARGTDHLFVSCVNPASLFIMNLIENTGHYISLSNIFPKTYFKPRIQTFPLPNNSFKDSLVLHEEMTNTLLVLDLHDRKMFVYNSGMRQSITNAINSFVPGGDANKYMRIFPTPESSTVFLGEIGGTSVFNIDFMQQKQININLAQYLPPGTCISGINPLSDTQIIISTFEQGNHSNELYLLTFDGDSCGLEKLETDKKLCLPLKISSKSMKNEIGNALISSEGKDYRLISDENNLANIIVDLADEKGILYSVARDSNTSFGEAPNCASESPTNFVNPSNSTVLLENMAQIIKATPVFAAPKHVIDKDMKSAKNGGFLEIVDLPSKSVKFIPVPVSKFPSMDLNWTKSITNSNFVVCEFGSEGVLTADISGGIRAWETVNATLDSSLTSWRRQMGLEKSAGQMEATLEKEDGSLDKLTEPKHGMVDPTGAPHVGGGMWAGGSGGFNTAGLGGIGGPYRLDSGNPVFQSSDQMKQQVPDHIKEKAREMGRRAYKQRLEEIKMSELDANAYNKFKEKVDSEIDRLRVTIDSLQAKGKERLWVRHQTSGDVDEGKLIEGLTGEKSVYRRRTEKEPESGTPQQKPKRLRLCVDVSGSMYRFNGHDKRLYKSLEATLMLMEALHGYEHKFKYDIVGHSGEEVDLKFVSMDSPPKNEKHRFDVLRQMIAHSQFCWSGDNTLECIKKSVSDLSKENDCDEYFCVLLSDANLERYGITPKHLTKMINRDDKVNVFTIFIGSLGSQAEKLRRELPAGKSFVCEDTKQLPHILNNIFTSSLLKANSN